MKFEIQQIGDLLTKDLSDKIDSIDVYVTVPTGLKVAGNGRLISVIPEATKETSVGHNCGFALCVAAG